MDFTYEPIATEKKMSEASNREFDHLFFHGDNTEGFQHNVQQVTEKLVEVMKHLDEPYAGKTPETLQRELNNLSVFTYEGEAVEGLLNKIDDSLLRSNIHITHPKSIAHLHCPPLVSSMAAEMIINTFNPSMDSWDQSPAATYLEQEVIKWLTKGFGFDGISDGVFTSGGTQSNYMGLLIARDSFCKRKWGVDVQKQGLPDDFKRLRILCSEEAHFTVQKSASQLGLGEASVVSINTDENHKLCLYDLKKKLKLMEAEQLLPFALVGTCGTTDFGSIDPLAELAAIASEHGVWLHVDAAFGGALILSHSYKDKLKGINQADSIAVDFHKLFYQPISCGAFLLKDKQEFVHLQHHADYLNPAEDDEKGIVHLVNKSIQTTRRFDALKLFFSLRMVGTKQYGAMIDQTIALAKSVASYMDGLENIRVIHADPELNTVVFRYEPTVPSVVDVNQVNLSIQKHLLYGGKGVIAKTMVEEEVCLKFTLLNPRTQLADVKEILTDIEEIGEAELKEWRVSV
ncbi:L-2,4-diaminobutyrate decarboxylase [Thalassobacillus cyri]|uniref:L-2,4-diaminobutyrate decarboxylase n=1 Tax=Thalassobacillus cyri TaxID=571932 RepID=A0A1H3W6T2_9BACI|nr:aspartate aminotransferase family protein [Thalassobacillus cyri]SDZ82710.1 L-2,4-diaminobutyrate decarboxylase [Thalassobacillus cyri]